MSPPQSLYLGRRRNRKVRFEHKIDVPSRPLSFLQSPLGHPEREGMATDGTEEIGAGRARAEGRSTQIPIKGEAEPPGERRLSQTDRERRSGRDSDPRV